MPQKMNPDLAELVRGKSGRVVGDLGHAGHGREGPAARLQQGPAGDAGAALRRGRDRRSRASHDRARHDRERSMFDTARHARRDRRRPPRRDRARRLPRHARACRSARRTTSPGHLVRVASERGVELAALDLDELQAAHPAFDADVAEWLDPARAVDRRDVVGGPARDARARRDRPHRSASWGTTDREPMRSVSSTETTSCTAKTSRWRRSPRKSARRSTSTAAASIERATRRSTPPSRASRTRSATRSKRTRRSACSACSSSSAPARTSSRSASSIRWLQAPAAIRRRSCSRASARPRPR